jgi:predicted negative regulator of RcsB-dependent stress response
MKTAIVVIVLAVAAFAGYRYFVSTQAAEVVTDPIVVGPVIAEPAAASAAQ